MEPGLEPKEVEKADYIAAAAAGDIEVVEDFLVRYPDHVRWQDPEQANRSAAMLAAEAGHFDVLRLLLVAGIANPPNRQLRDDFRQTALHYAAMNTDPRFALLLLHYAKEINIRGSDGMTPAQVALEVGAHATLKAIVEDGWFNPNLGDDREDTALHMAARRRDLTALKILLHRREGCAKGYKLVDPGITNEEGLTPLAEAAKTGWVEGATALIAKHPYLLHTKVEKAEGPETTAAHVAAYFGQPEMLAFLLAKGADPEAVNASGHAPLHCLLLPTNPDQPPAGAMGLAQRLECLRLLLEQEPQPNPADGAGNTPMHYAIFGLAHQLALGAEVPSGLFLERVEYLEWEKGWAAVAALVEGQGKWIGLCLATIMALLMRGWDWEGLSNADGITPRNLLKKAQGRMSLKAASFADDFLRLAAMKGLEAGLARPSQRPSRERGLQCDICLDRTKNMAFACGHLACEECTKRILAYPMKEKRVCHICRASLEDNPPYKVHLQL